MSTQHTHLGRNVKRLREILGMKQEALAIELGADWNQKKISMLEAKDVIDRPLLEQIAQVLKVPVDAIENFDEQGTVLNIQNNYDSSKDNSQNYQYQCTFNPLDKIIALVEENKALYERLLQEKEEKLKLLEGMVKK